VEIRNCDRLDLDLLDRWIPSGGRTSFHRRRFARQDRGEGTYLVAWRDGRPVGHVEIRWSGCAAPHVRAAVVRCPELNAPGVWPPELRRRGWGTALLRAAEVIVSTRGHAVVGLGVTDDNVDAAALYARLGYADRGLRYQDRWSWVDQDGVVHDESAWATFLVKNLNRG
jgi:GNAT superfamily N-acetyltransferase